MAAGQEASGHRRPSTARKRRRWGGLRQQWKLLGLFEIDQQHEFYALTCMMKEGLAAVSQKADSGAPTVSIGNDSRLSASQRVDQVSSLLVMVRWSSRSMVCVGFLRSPERVWSGLVQVELTMVRLDGLHRVLSNRVFLHCIFLLACQPQENSMCRSAKKQRTLPGGSLAPRPGVRPGLGWTKGLASLFPSPGIGPDHCQLRHP